ncbi:hypothetical protein BDV19DRAFT_389553 [Aspergillus venezuelensis]
MKERPSGTKFLSFAVVGGTSLWHLNAVLQFDGVVRQTRVLEACVRMAVKLLDLFFVTALSFVVLGSAGLNSILMHVEIVPQFLDDLMRGQFIGASRTCLGSDETDWCSIATEPKLKRAKRVNHLENTTNRRENKRQKVSNIGPSPCHAGGVVVDEGVGKHYVDSKSDE